jgi:ribosome-interacting GTPase 1
MLRELPKHKGTDKLQADLKQKISRLKKDLAAGPKQRRSGGLRIPRQGAGRVILLGSPNSGKSQFVATMTRAEPEIADYPFTTREAGPAMMPFEDVLIQLIDTPPVTRDVLDPNLFGLVRGADLALLFLDLGADDGLADCREVIARFEESRTRLGRSTHLDEDDVGLAFTQTFLVASKIDLPDAELRLDLFREQGLPDFECFLLSATDPKSTAPLCQAIFAALDVVRVYTKLPTAKAPDFDKPFTIRRGGTLGDIAAQIHKDMADKLKFAKVWGAQVHDGTAVKPDYVLCDKDVIELHS